MACAPPPRATRPGRATTTRNYSQPPAVLSLTAVFGSVAPPAYVHLEGQWEAFWENCTQTSYLQARLQWQNRVPTFARMRSVLERLSDGSGSDNVSLETVCAEFLRALRSFAESVYLEVQHARGHETWDVQWASAALAELLEAEESNAHTSRISPPVVQDVLGRVMQLRQAELSTGCNDLTHAVPPLLRGHPRRGAGLQAQRVSPPMAASLRVAFHRGIRFLVSDYSAELPSC